MLSVAQLLSAMSAHGATRFFAKKLAPNDNSKNQFYLGGGFGSLSVLPHGEIVPDSSKLGRSVRDRAKAKLCFFWLDSGCVCPAPEAQLILYPEYPEVRLSGLLNRSPRAPSHVIKSRAEGRVLILGTCPDGRVLGYATERDHPVAREIAALQDPDTIGVFLVLRADRSGAQEAENQLLAELRRIHELGWISSQKLDANGQPAPYVARNGGGYTLEAALGIAPNGRAEPDYLGWELKQFGVNDLAAPRAKSPITLMTPEPLGGDYRTLGAAAFIRRFGYPDKRGREDRLNFGGVYACNAAPHADTKLALTITGFDASSGKISDMAGEIALVTTEQQVAASWPFTELVEHWTRKHARAAYIPSISRAAPAAYAYGALITLCLETDFHLFLRALASGRIWYDPGLKLEQAGGPSPKLKRRSQFRIKQTNLGELYRSLRTTDVRLTG
jgi:hypothetical protein